MLKTLIIAIVLVLSSMSASPVFAQTRLHKDFAASKDTYSESKRLYSEGVKYALAGLFAQAAQLFQQAVRLDPQFADAHFALGHAYYDMGRWQNAIDSFKRAVELNPNDLEAQDRLEEAREMLARETGKQAKATPTKSAEPAKPEPLRQPVAEKISLNAKPEAPPVATTETSKSETNESSTKVSSSTKANAAANDLALTRLYCIGPGDVLDIRINDSPAPQSTLFTITPAGLLEHPLLAEPLNVGGLSVEEVGSSIEGDLKRRALMESPQMIAPAKSATAKAKVIQWP